MKFSMTLSQSGFRALAAGFMADAAQVAVCFAGRCSRPDEVEFLVHAVRWGRANVLHTGMPVLICSAARAELLPVVLHDELRRWPYSGDGALLAIGVGAASGILAGFAVTRNGPALFEKISIVDAGLPLCGRKSQLDPGNSVLHASHPEIWSRTIGALGADAWRRLTSLRFGIIGCGRSGSLMATSLTRMGVRDLILIDPDRVEPHNVGEMDAVGLDDVQCSKASRVAAHLKRTTSTHTVSVRDLTESVFSLAALAEIKASDFLVCCVDDASARIATDFLAKLFLKPLLDLGTGVLGQSGGERRVGADIRLVLPDRCLLCMGGVMGLPDASPMAASRHWREQRAGSLRSLNETSVGLGLRLIEEFLRGDLQNSAWLQLDIDRSGLPHLESRHPLHLPSCRLCAVAGLGDTGVPSLPVILVDNVAQLDEKFVAATVNTNGR